MAHSTGWTRDSPGFWQPPSQLPSPLRSAHEVWNRIQRQLLQGSSGKEPREGQWQCPGSDAHADCGAPGALKTALRSGSRVLQPGPRGGWLSPLLRSASAPPSFRPGRARRQLRGAQNHPRHAGVALPACRDASPVLTARNRASLGRDQNPVTQSAAPPPRLQ
ncbi:hypothetical protein NN561_010241 [Cricetulus griseus]